jgi:predicted acyltransferase
VLKRCALLCVIGIVLDSVSQRVPTLQFIRVLQQIAIGYFLAFFVLHLGWRFQAAAIVVILLAHTLTYMAYGGSGTGGPWERDHNLGAAIDALLHAPFAGLTSIRIFPASTGGYVTLNAFSSTATILFGVLAGEILRTQWSPRSRLLSLLTLGTALVALGLALTPCVPMIKRLWTSSFALYSAGWTYLMMAAFYAIIDVAGWRRWSFPFVVVGMNSIFIYVAASLLSGPLRRVWRTAFGGLLDSLGPWEPVVIALLVSLSLWFLCYVLYRRGIFLKV